MERVRYLLRMSDEPEWRRLNRANWDERVGVHLGPRGYHSQDLRAGHGALNAIEEAELGQVAGLRILHLQCHFGRDSLCLAQRGATVVGLDFSPPAIAAARALANELGLAVNARFILSDIYAARDAIPEPASFDLVFITWGTICWLPDITEWARIIAHFLKPGGVLYFAEAHPAALVFDDLTTVSDGRPGWFAPYFHEGALEIDEERDYIDPQARLTNRRTHQFMHPISAVVTALLQAGLVLEWLHEHKEGTWRMFGCQTEGADGLFRWPDKPWLPLSYSLRARKG
jgi:SAM-dependent methyltransferase